MEKILNIMKNNIIIKNIHTSNLAEDLFNNLVK